MAMNHAKEFINKMLENEELRNKFAAMNTEDGLAAAKDMGLDFTTDELKQAGEDYEMPAEQLDNVNGGGVWGCIKGAFAGLASGAAGGCLIGCIGGPVGAAIGTMVGGSVGCITGGMYGGFSSED